MESASFFGEGGDLGDVRRQLRGNRDIGCGVNGHDGCWRGNCRSHSRAAGWAAGLRQIEVGRARDAVKAGSAEMMEADGREIRETSRWR